jgi:low affinity Fe/Cu permease
MKIDFDQFAELSSGQVSRSWFFLACVAIVIAWAPTLAFMSIDSSQLIINTVTTVITFLLVALLQNAQDRATKAMTHKLDAIIEAQILLLDDSSEACRVVRKRLEDMLGTEMEKSK